MSILNKIIANKRVEIQNKKELIPVKRLETSLYFEGDCVSLSHYIERDDKSGIIAEFKRHSPSRGDINPFADPAKICLGYMQSGASALSVLTDEPFFKGNNADLIAAREWNFCPILRKDFIVDEYQIIEAKSIGADSILLISATLEDKEVKSFTKLAHSLGLQVLFEIHELAELTDAAAEADLIGVNSRSLKLMKVLPDHHLAVAQSINTDKPIIAESGISSPHKAFELSEAGYDGFLIGSSFMSESDPVYACRHFIQALEKIKSDSLVKIKN